MENKLGIEIASNVINSYNNVGDREMLDYIYKLDIKDKKAREMLEEMIVLNDIALDTPKYYEKRKEFLTYLGFTIDTDGKLKYKTEEYKSYITFIFQDMIRVDKSDYCVDDLYSMCKDLTNDYLISGFDSPNESLLECMNKYLNYKEEKYKKELKEKVISEWSMVLKENLDYSDKEDRQNATSILKTLNELDTWDIKRLEKELRNFGYNLEKKLYTT